MSKHKILSLNPDTISDKRSAEFMRKYNRTHGLLARSVDGFRIFPIGKLPEGWLFVTPIDLAVSGKTIQESFSRFNSILIGKSVSQVRTILHQFGLPCKNMEDNVTFPEIKPRVVPKSNLPEPKPIQIKLSASRRYNVLKEYVGKLRHITGENYGLIIRYSRNYCALTLNGKVLDGFEGTMVALRNMLLNEWACLRTLEMSDDELQAAYDSGQEDLVDMVFGDDKPSIKPQSTILERK